MLSPNQQTASFTFNAGSTPVPFLIDLFGSTSLGKGFDSAQFQVFDNGKLVVNQSFANSTSAQAFFSNNALFVKLAAGLNTVLLAFSEMISGGDGFSVNYATASVRPAPAPAIGDSLPGLVIGFGISG